MKDPVKLASKELPKYGAKILHRYGKNVVFDLPNGGRWTVGPGTRLAHVREVINDSYLAHMGLRGFMNVADPEIKPEQLRSSDHFLDRLDLMNGQASVTMREVLEALAHPVKVMATYDMRKLAVLGPRVAPLVAQDGDELVLITLRWSTAELWARYPRPGKE